MCSLERKGDVFILTLSGNSDHRFNPATLQSISAALHTVAQSPDAVALVTTNEGRYFSNGLDLKWIAEDSQKNLEIIRHKFEDVLAAFMRLGVPTIAALRGHAAAGGLMFALTHDYRFMLDGHGHGNGGRGPVLYMSEVDLGMRMPASLAAVVRSKLTPRAVREVLLKGSKLQARQALDLGVVDRLCSDADTVLAEAVAEAQALATRKWNKDVYAQIRLSAFPGVVEELDAHRDSYVFPSVSNL